MITVEKLEKGTYFDDAFKISFRYDPTTVAKVKELAERRYLPEDRAWEIPAHELPALIEKVGLNNIKSEETVVQALNTKEIEDKREATQERLKGIKPVRDFDFKTAPLPHQIEAFNYGMEKNSLLIGDEQGLGKTKESIDICVARKKELIKTLIVCGVNSVKYNWEKEIQIHSNESCVMVDGKTMDVRVQQLNDWYRGSAYFGVINIESLRNEKIQDALYLGIKDGYIGAIIVDEIHKAKNGGSQQGKALRFLKAPVKIGLSGTPMNKAEDLWNILTWLGVERRSFYSFKNAYCTMGGFGGYKVIGYKNLNDLNAELNTVMLKILKYLLYCGYYWSFPDRYHFLAFAFLGAVSLSITTSVTFKASANTSCGNSPASTALRVASSSTTSLVAIQLVRFLSWSSAKSFSSSMLLRSCTIRSKRYPASSV